MKTSKIILLLILGIALFLIVLGVYRFNYTNDDIYVRTDNGEVVPHDEYKKENLIKEDIDLFEQFKNAKISAPETHKMVQLTDGIGFYEIVPDSASRGEVLVIDGLSTLWQEGPDRTDFAAIVTLNSGGTGRFYYLTLFNVSGNSFTKKSEVFLGDRIEVTHMGLGELVHGPDVNYRITLKTLERNESDSMASKPTVEKTRVFYVTEQILEEISDL